MTVALLACGEGGSPAPTPTLPPQATATPVDLGPPHPEVDRVLEHIRVLSVEIGSRPAGSPQEMEAIAYAREQFERWGYRVDVQAFAVSSELLRAASLVVEQPERRSLPALPFLGAPAGAVSGRLLDAGTGRQEEFPSDAGGAIVLIQRLDVPFVDMARRARAAGAGAVIVANREPGLFHGGFDPPIDLPVIAIDQADGEALRTLLAAGTVEVTVTVEEQREVATHNIIARLPGSACRTMSGAHYDSVPATPGAGDNASGSAMVLELARAAAAAGLSGHCFVLFGAEETGLDGSELFVSRLTTEERETLSALFNYDVVAGNAPPLAAGSDGLLDRAEELAEREGLDVEFSPRPGEIPSDHLSFLEAGIPALILTSPDFDRIHTAEDTLANLDPGSLAAIASLGFALLQELSEGG